MMKGSVTFVLPGDNRSGGVRVTAVMGNELLKRGYQVRIAHPRPPLVSLASMKRRLPRLLGGKPATANAGWLHLFKGKVETYSRLAELEYAPKEVVIAVGTFTVNEVRALPQDVLRVRFNHGFPAEMTPENQEIWSLPMPTITVSQTLVPRLEAMSGRKVLAVIPNGIDLTDYFPAPGVKRDGVGTIFSMHPNKAPADIVRLFQLIAREFPEVPRRVFSTEVLPADFPPCEYEQLPSVPRAREIYSSCKVWLLASRTEGLPGPVLEAMACGAVMVSTDNDGSLEVIKDGVNGLIAPRGNMEAFLPLIRRLLTNESERQRLVDAGFTTAKEFSWDRAAEKMDVFLTRILAQPDLIANPPRVETSTGK
jgi:glycosyltransferase involved in cell wall biosynthesis